MCALKVEDSLVGCLELQTTPDSPIAAPHAVHLVRRAFRSVATLQPNREAVGDVDVATNLGSPFFDNRVVSHDASDRTPAASILQAANNVRHVAVDGEAVVTLFKSNYSREAVATSEGVRDLAGAVAANCDHVIVDDIAEVTGEGLEFRLIDTDLEAAEFDIGELQSNVRTCEAVVTIMTRVSCAVVEAGFGVGLQRAVFGFRSGRGAKRETSALVPALTVETGVDVIAALYVVTDVAMDAQAGFGARDVEVASAVCVANANIFNGFGLWRDDCVGSLSAGSCNQSCSGAEKKALDVHF